MKNIKIFILLLAVATSIVSCVKDDDHLGRKKASEIQLWTYTLPSSNEIFTHNKVPAIDENDNIYIFSQKDMTSNDDLISVTKDGSVRWTKKTNGFICSRLIYKTDKLFYVTHIEVGLTPTNIITCANANSGDVIWSHDFLADYEDNAMAASDDGIFYAVYDTLYKYDFSGNLLSKISLTGELSTQLIGMSIHNNNIYILGQMGNTFETDLIKCSDNTGSLSVDWRILFSSANSLFNESEVNGSVDLSINDLGDVTLLSSGGLYCFDVNGDLKWKQSSEFSIYGTKSSNSAAISSTTVTDSGYVLIGFEQFIKLDNEGKIVVKTENHLASFNLQRAPIIGANGKYYSVNLGADGGGVRAINPDGSQYWYSFLPICDDAPAMLHNGNLVFIYEDILYCVQTESGGLDLNAQWPKIYYDYGNTGFKNN